MILFHNCKVCKNPLHNLYGNRQISFRVDINESYRCLFECFEKDRKISFCSLTTGLQLSIKMRGSNSLSPCLRFSLHWQKWYKLAKHFRFSNSFRTSKNCFGYHVNKFQWWTYILWPYRFPQWSYSVSQRCWPHPGFMALSEWQQDLGLFLDWRKWEPLLLEMLEPMSCL